MGWDWKNTIGKFFSVSAQPQITAAMAGLSPEATHGMQQLANGTHRSYSRAELQDITESLRDLKDATRHNLVVLHNLMNARPKNDEPALKELLSKVKTDLATSYSASEQSMVDLNRAANTLEQISAKAGASYNSAQDHLPVYDTQKNMVIGMTAQLRSIYTVHNGLTKMVANLQPHITLPEPDRVAQALKSNNEKLPDLLPKLTRLTMETLGRAPQLAPTF